MSPASKTGVNVKQAVPFFHVSNMEGSLRFYVEGLDFLMTKRWIDEGKLRWCWLEIGDAALMLEEFRKEGQDSWKPSCFLSAFGHVATLHRDMIFYKMGFA
jgi:hypothetical protein